VARRHAQGLRIGAAGALAVLGFGASFGLARMTRDEAKANTPTQAEASIAVLPPEAARLVRLAPGGAVPALRPPATTAAPPVQEPAPRTTVAPQPQAQPTTAPAPEPTTAPPPTTYIP
jgi:hypothetical protein